MWDVNHESEVPYSEVPYPRLRKSRPIYPMYDLPVAVLMQDRPAY